MYRTMVSLMLTHLQVLSSIPGQETCLSTSVVYRCFHSWHAIRVLIEMIFNLTKILNSNVQLFWMGVQQNISQWKN